MKKINVIEELKQRGIFNNISDFDKFSNLHEQVAIYTGFDPTASSLHLGNYVQIANLLRFKQFGYKPIAIIGGITGMIGDPSFRVSERKYLPIEEINNNKIKIKAQLEKFGITVIDNLDFYKNWTLVDFLRNIGTLVNINYLLNKESIATRLDKGLSFTEFSYQLIQGWDFKTLYDKYNVKIQLGGSDQWGNITTGLEIIRKTNGENNNAIGITANLLLDDNGNKFGKSTGGNNLWLDSKMTSPYNMYQFLLNQSDEKVNELLLWLTFLDTSEINNIINEHQKNKHLRKAQKILAFNVIKTIHSENVAMQCEKISSILFSKSENIDKLNDDDFSLLLGFLPSFIYESSNTIGDFIKENKILSSNREIKEFISNKALTINGKTVESLDEKIIFPKSKKYLLLKKGKKDFYILKNK